MTQEDDYFLNKFGVGNLNHITTGFEKCAFQPEQIFHFKVTRIYDPSKFWIVAKYREFELYQKELFKWYYQNRAKYRIPPNKIEFNMYCVVFADCGYYRGIVTGFPSDLQTEPEVQVYFIDCGTLKTVEPSNVYYLSRRHSQVPQFAMRASLAGLAPRVGPNWTWEDCQEFLNLVDNKILRGLVVAVSTTREVVYIRCCDDETQIEDVLISKKRARYWDEAGDSGACRELLQPKLKYQYLFPTHEALESGKVPPTLPDFEYLRQVAPDSSVVLRYYKEGNKLEEAKEAEISQ